MEIVTDKAILYLFTKEDYTKPIVKTIGDCDVLTTKYEWKKNEISYRHLKQKVEDYLYFDV